MIGQVYIGIPSSSSGIGTGIPNKIVLTANSRPSWKIHSYRATRYTVSIGSSRTGGGSSSVSVRTCVRTRRNTIKTNSKKLIMAIAYPHIISAGIIKRTIIPAYGRHIGPVSSRRQIPIPTSTAIARKISPIALLVVKSPIRRQWISLHISDSNFNFRIGICLQGRKNYVYQDK